MRYSLSAERLLTGIAQYRAIVASAILQASSFTFGMPFMFDIMPWRIFSSTAPGGIIPRNH